MPRVRRRRTIRAAPVSVWEYASDPRNLPRWWPKTTSVRDLSGSGRTPGSRWTQVLQAKSGRRVGANLICTAEERPSLWRFEQDTEGTPFERMLKAAWTEIRLRDAGPDTLVELELGQKLQGLSRLGGLFVRSASGRTAEEALANLAGQLESSDEEPAS